MTSQPLPFYKGLTLQVTHRECLLWLPVWLNTHRPRESRRMAGAGVGQGREDNYSIRTRSDINCPLVKAI